MKIPKRVKVGPFYYAVEYSKDISDEGDCYGSTHHESHKIFLEPGVPQDRIEETFFHELLHVCMHVNGISYRLRNKEDHVSEEDFVRDTSVVFFQVFKDNPKIFK